MFLFISVAIVSFASVAFLMALIFREVVPANQVHIVQSRNKTMSFGKDTSNGNVYYKWPSCWPVIGVEVVDLPVSVFSLTLDSYAAYDLGRVPFLVDVQAFFRISDSNLAASRIANFNELRQQLNGLLQGAARAMLASSDIEEIMQGRSEFGSQFTKEVKDQLRQWGVETVKNIELMDIRDTRESHVISNIMAKKKSLIEKESRIEVANNNKEAEVAEVQAVLDADMKKVEAKEQVDKRMAEQQRTVGVATEKARQEVQSEQKVTKEKEMEVVRVHDVKRQEINREMGIVKAEEEKKKQVLAAEANLESQKRNAEAHFEMERKKADGIAAVGAANASAEKAMQLAPVEAQIVLAKEIGENGGYQEYLLSIKRIEADQAVGMEQAKALEKAEVKLFANGANAGESLSKAGKVFTPKRGLDIASAVEALASTEVGQSILGKLTK